jgi:hypothetical protein
MVREAFGYDGVLGRLTFKVYIGKQVLLPCIPKGLYILNKTQLDQVWGVKGQGVSSFLF